MRMLDIAKLVLRAQELIKTISSMRVSEEDELQKMKWILEYYLKEDYSGLDHEVSHS